MWELKNRKYLETKDAEGQVRRHEVNGQTCTQIAKSMNNVYKMEVFRDIGKDSNNFETRTNHTVLIWSYHSDKEAI